MKPISTDFRVWGLEDVCVSTLYFYSALFSVSVLALCRSQECYSSGQNLTVPGLSRTQQASIRENWSPQGTCLMLLKLAGIVLAVADSVDIDCHRVYVHEFCNKPRRPFCLWVCCTGSSLRRSLSRSLSSQFGGCKGKRLQNIETIYIGQVISFSNGHCAYYMQNNWHVQIWWGRGRLQDDSYKLNCNDVTHI